jgi:hypothetical protein
MLFGLHKSNVCRIIQRLEPILLKIMSLPQRDKLSPDEVRDLIIDATENQSRIPSM